MTMGTSPPLDRGLSVVPSEEWQDSISKRLAYAAASSPLAVYDAGTSSRSFDGGGPAVQRRRLNTMPSSGTVPDWNSMYSMEPDSEGTDPIHNPTERMGELSLDENHEVCCVPRIS